MYSKIFLRRNQAINNEIVISFLLDSDYSLRDQLPNTNDSFARLPVLFPTIFW